MRAAVDPFTSVIRTLQYNYEYIASRHACVACISRRIPDATVYRAISDRRAWRGAWRMAARCYLPRY